MAKRYFDEDYLDSLKPKRKGRYEVGDLGCRGLIVRVQPSGVKSLYALFKIREGHPDPTKVGKNGRRLASPQQRVLLGRWGMDDITLPKAREKTNGIIKLARQGKDPREPEKAHRANTVEAVARRYIKVRCKPNFKIGTEIERLFEMHIFPTLGQVPIAAVTAERVGALLDTYIEADKVGTARKMRVRLTALYNWAKERGLVVHNPASKLRRQELAPKNGTGYELRDTELKAVWAAACDMGYPYGDIYRLLILTGQRWSDWCRASWHEIHDGMLDIPTERYKTGSKTGHGHTVPLSKPVQALLDGLPFSDRDEWLFWNSKMSGPAVRKNEAVRLRDLALVKLREQTEKPAAKLHHFRPHDFRHTCETRLSRLGIREEVRRATLGHTKRGMTSQYNKHDFWPERVETLALYAEEIARVVS